MDYHLQDIESQITDFYLSVHDATGKTYTDTTGNFFVPSTKENN